jgi:hypothetical protein
VREEIGKTDHGKGKEEKKWPVGTRSDAIANDCFMLRLFGGCKETFVGLHVLFSATVQSYVQASSSNRLE